MGKGERGKSLYVADVDTIVENLPGTPKYKTNRWPEEGRTFRTRETKKEEREKWTRQEKKGATGEKMDNASNGGNRKAYIMNDSVNW